MLDELAAEDRRLRNGSRQRRADRGHPSSALPSGRGSVVLVDDPSGPSSASRLRALCVARCPADAENDPPHRSDDWHRRSLLSPPPAVGHVDMPRHP